MWWWVSLGLYVFGGLMLIGGAVEWKSPPEGKTRKDARDAIIMSFVVILLGYWAAPADQPAPEQAVTPPAVVAEQPPPAPAPEASTEDPQKTELEQARAEAEQARKALGQAQAEIASLKQQAEAKQEQAEANPAAVQALMVASGTEDKPQPEPDPQCKLAGKVISIADGDTVTVLDAAREKHKIRLAGIDAPEKSQPFGDAAKKHLSSLIGKQEVCVEWHKLDKYGRKVGKITVNGEDVDLKMVQDGYAWHFKKYASEQSEEDRILYADAHDKARSDTLGLWSEPDPIEPDAWRAGERPKKAEPVVMPDQDAPVQALVAEAAEASCGAKRYCKQMSSCAEACHYLNDCGLSRLDRDNDGRPCESLCKRACN